MELSKLQVYSIGIVAKNKPLSSRIIEVTPIENTPMASGELTDNAVDYKAAGANDQGAAYQVQVASTVTIKATWLPMHSSNRTTAPDVRRGEKVIIYRFADTDEFWWATLMDDLHLRKLETVIYAFSGTRDEAAKPNADNTYFLEISTHNKLVHFHTSKADQEPFAYDIQINTKDGAIVIKDDIGNFFSFDSKERRLELKNADSTHFDMDKKNLTITVPETLSIQAKNIQQNADVNTKLTSDSYNIDVSSLAENANSGEIVIGSGDVIAAGKSLVGHTHLEQGDGMPTSAPM